MEYISQADGSKQRAAKRAKKGTLSERMDNVESIVASLMVDVSKISRFAGGQRENDPAFKTDVRRKLQLMWDSCTNIEHRLDMLLQDKEKNGMTSIGIETEEDPVDMVISQWKSSKQLCIQEGKSTIARSPTEVELQASKSFITPALVKSKAKGKKVLTSDKIGALTRRLFHADSVKEYSTDCIMKHPKAEDGSHEISPGKNEKVSIPVGLEVVFHPVKSMFLTDLEVQVAAYIYSSKKSIDEILVDSSSGFLHRRDLHSLTPNRWVYGRVLTMVASKMTYEERKKSVIRYWYLPPTFSEETIEGGLTPDLAMNDYCLLYMSNSVNSLEKIYIPITDDNVHWFLLVISMKDEKLLYLDSAPSPATEGDRHEKIIQMAVLVENLFKNNRLHNTRWNIAPEISKWPIVVPAGVPRQDNFYECGVWVAGWMTLDAIWGDYQTVPRGAYGCVRLALDLVLGEFNRKKDQVVLAAKEFWSKHDNVIYI